MILNTSIIELIKAKSNLSFEKAKDYDALCDIIFKSTGRTIGVNTLKRLMGYISDNRKTNEYTLNTVALFLDYKSWEEMCNSVRIDSDWHFDTHTIFVDNLPIGSTVIVKYLNRIVKFCVILDKGKNMLKVIYEENSSLREGDILDVKTLCIGEKLEAAIVYRGELTGNYKTNGELKEIKID